jgi:hypothetical protein
MSLQLTAAKCTLLTAHLAAVDLHTNDRTRGHFAANGAAQRAFQQMSLLHF